MANKKMDLQTWIEKDKELKIEFLKYEISLQRLISRHTIDNGAIENFIAEKQYAQTPNYSYNFSYTFDNFPNLGTIPIYLSVWTFEQLKKNFRTFKFQLTNTRQNRVKKQIYLDQKVLTRLERIMTDNNLSSLQNSINFVLDENNFQLKKKNEQIKQFSEQQNVLQEQLNQAQYQLSENTKIINQLQFNRWQLENKLETYVEATLLPIITTRLQEILKKELAPITDQQFDSVDLDTLISKKIKSEVIGQLYYYFISAKESS
ncbi:hypothetical protein ACNPMZ_05265 [Acinetobacter pittii]|uniref:hypothetical protein n=1 Tax=Acinetobacter pittii TaxID=48296 RepID=UPI003AA88600